MTERSRQVFFHFLLLTAVLAYAAVALVSFARQWLADRPSPENVTKGLRWHLETPTLWHTYARYCLFGAEGFEPRQAAGAYLRAIALNPFEQRAWEELATAYLQMQEPGKAEAALRAGMAAMPHSPDAAWRLANFLLLQGRTNEAVPYLRIAAASERRVRPAVYDLAWKILPEADFILRNIVPAHAEAQGDYLRFLMARKKLQETYGVWRLVWERGPEIALPLGYSYVEALAIAGLGAEAERVWGEILAGTGRTPARPPGELLTNGDFEAELPNAGLDWRLASGPGYKVSVDNFVLQQGSRSLRVSFDGGANPDFAAVWQLVPVEPNGAYRFQGYIKTENITSDSGPRFSIASVAAPPEQSFAHHTESGIGTEPWRKEQLDFRTGPAVRMVQVGVRRLRSVKFNNLIGGKVWVDHLSLQKIPE